MVRPRAVSIWLVVCTALVFAMIVLGGITRVTRSGLSITTWDPILGVVPPTSDAAWRGAFERYQASPEGAALAGAIDLARFRELYLVEWAHRLLARVTGLAVALPLAVFIARKRIDARLARALGGIVALVVAQGTLGWLMVASGLVDRPYVSPFRLAGHMLLGVTLLAALAWLAFEPVAARTASGARAATVVALGAAFVTVGLGALMAGFHAGLVCSTFPTMDGAWIPRLRASDWARTIHFAHRLAALVLASTALAAAALAQRGSRAARRLSGALLAGLVLQVALGALLVLHRVPPALAVAHQANGALVVVGLVGLLRQA